MSENNNDKKKKLNFTTDFIHKTAAQLYEIKKMHYNCNDQDNYDFDEEDLSVASKKAFIQQNKKELKEYGMFKNDNASEAFLEKHLNLICEKSYIYLRRWFIHFFL